MVLDYLKHLFLAQNAFKVHSPFVYDFYQKVLHPNSFQEATKDLTQKVRALRWELQRSKEVLEFPDFGAGAGDKERVMRQRKVSEMVRTAARPSNHGEFLYRLCKTYDFRRAVELGTHLGFSAIYQRSAMAEEASFISMEGAPSVAQKAKQHFQELNLEIDIRIGAFEKTLPGLDLQSLQPDYVFIDGNHRYQATLDYFHSFLPHMPNNSCMVFDDIYWSSGMKKAWQEIAAHPDITVSIDLFWLGICFIKRNQAKEHFRFRLK